MNRKIKELLKKRDELKNTDVNQFGKMPEETKNKIALVDKDIKKLLDEAIQKAKACLLLPEFKEYKELLGVLTDRMESRILGMTGQDLFIESERIKLFENMIRHQTLKNILTTIENDAEDKVVVQ